MPHSSQTGALSVPKMVERLRADGQPTIFIITGGIIAPFEVRFDEFREGKMEPAKKVARVRKRSSRSVREFTHLRVILHVPYV